MEISLFTMGVKKASKQTKNLLQPNSASREGLFLWKISYFEDSKQKRRCYEFPWETGVGILKEKYNWLGLKRETDPQHNLCQGVCPACVSELSRSGF